MGSEINTSSAPPLQYSATALTLTCSHRERGFVVKISIFLSQEHSLGWASRFPSQGTPALHRL